jgi:hypothetical protein
MATTLGVQSAAATNDLGNVISVHQHAVVGSRGRKIQSYIAFGVGGVGLLMALIGWLTGSTEMLALCGGGLAVAGLGLGALGLADAGGTMDATVAIHEAGIRYSDKKGSKAWRWEQVAQVFIMLRRYQNTQIVRRAYRLHNTTGDSFYFTDEVRDAEGAFNAIRQRAYPPLFSRLIEQYDAGQTVSFGKVTVSRASGLTIGKKAFRWDEITGAKVSGGYLFISKAGLGWLNDGDALVAEIANVELLIRIIEQRLGKQI